MRLPRNIAAGPSLALRASALLLALSATTAWADGERSVTLLGVSGPDGAPVGALIEAGLADRFEVVDGDVYRYLAEKINRRGPSPAEVREVARRLRIDAVIEARCDARASRSRYAWWSATAAAAR